MDGFDKLQNKEITQFINSDEYSNFPNSRGKISILSIVFENPASLEPLIVNIVGIKVLFGEP